MKRFLYLLGALVLLFSACSKKQGTNVSQKEKILVINNYAEPEYLDPALTTDDASSHIVDQIFEGLTDFNPKTLEPIPAVAEKWEISKDGKVYTFHLRKEAKWSDGSPVTAHDFVYSWQRVLDPKTAARYAYQLFYVKNGEEINNGSIKDLNALGARALDDYTLQVELKNPTPYFLSLAAWYTLRPVKKEVVEKFDRRWTRPENMVSNGYFKLVEWTPQKRVVLEPNPHYWDRKNVHLDKAIFLAVEDRETSLKMFLNGDIHYMDDPPAVKVPELRKHPEFVDGPELATYYVVINTARAALNQKTLRQSLNYAIDRKRLVQAINRGFASAGLTPSGTAGYNPPPGLEFDPKKAKELLLQAGFKDPKEVPTLTLVYNTSENHKMIMEIVQNMWKEHLGISVKLQNMEWKSLLKLYTAKDFDIARYGWVGDYNDPNTFLDLHVTGGGNNHTNWSNPLYDELIQKAQATTNQKERFRYFYEAEKILLDEAPIVPLYTYTRPTMQSKKLRGFHHNLQNIHPLKGVTLDE